MPTVPAADARAAVDAVQMGMQLGAELQDNFERERSELQSQLTAARAARDAEAARALVHERIFQLELMESEGQQEALRAELRRAKVEIANAKVECL